MKSISVYWSIKLNTLFIVWLRFQHRLLALIKDQRRLKQLAVIFDQSWLWMMKPDCSCALIALRNGVLPVVLLLCRLPTWSRRRVPVTATLAVAETKLQFEHRDLHCANGLVRPATDGHVFFRLQGIEHGIACHGIETKIIDFSLSRITAPGNQSICLSCVDMHCSVLYLDLPWSACAL